MHKSTHAHIYSTVLNPGELTYTHTRQLKETLLVHADSYTHAHTYAHTYMHKHVNSHTHMHTHVRTGVQKGEVAVAGTAGSLGERGGNDEKEEEEEEEEEGAVKRGFKSPQLLKVLQALNALEACSLQVGKCFGGAVCVRVCVLVDGCGFL